MFQGWGGMHAVNYNTSAADALAHDAAVATDQSYWQP